MSGNEREAPEIWAGVECTVNRVGDTFYDQCEMNGHDRRIREDLEKFLGLGIKKLRYPALWEKIASKNLSEFNWKNSDLALGIIKNSKVEPIVGLLHHGSGPLYTSLLDPEFPEKLAKFAGELANRYPWVTHFTPVNEPLTTARFSCLYGHWYPHLSDDHSFIRALYNEIKGTILSMQAIRKVIPDARLIQTEDLGKTMSTAPISYQAEFDNHRRWLTFDFLLGKVNKDHPLFVFMIEKGGLKSDELLWLEDNPCPPDVIGINHYPLSNRFLDHRLELYPENHHGGNGRDRYADVGAVDTGQITPPMPYEILEEVWERYQRPFAVTEAHIAGPRESQMRWFRETWESGKKLKEKGADFVAVTAWSLLGAYDWPTLCTANPCKQFYESGVFDIRSGSARPTALSRMIQQYAKLKEYSAPVLEQPGYWREPRRVIFAAQSEVSRIEAEFLPSYLSPRKSRPLLINGASGTLGRAFARVCDARGIDFRLVSRNEVDIANNDQVKAALDEMQPWAFINTAGYVRVDDAEADCARCHRENTIGPEILARACADRGIPLVTFSTDLVFSGNQRQPYLEQDLTSPLCHYGHTKALAEKIVTHLNEKALVIRTSSFFGPWDTYNFMRFILRELANGREFFAVEDMIISPTYVPDLVHTTLDLLLDGEKGLVHLANHGEISWADWARLTAKTINANCSLVIGKTREEIGLIAKRPTYSVLQSERLGRVMPTFENALGRFMDEINRQEQL